MSAYWIASLQVVSNDRSPRQAPCRPFADAWRGARRERDGFLEFQWQYPSVDVMNSLAMMTEQGRRDPPDTAPEAMRTVFVAL
jgi:hypothetical protein